MANVLTLSGCIADVADPLNIYKTREYGITEEFRYNCMGFAFQTFCWMHPRINQGYIDSLFEDRSCNDPSEKFLDEDDEVEYFTEDEIDSFETEIIQEIYNYNEKYNEYSDNDAAVGDVYEWGDWHNKISLSICVENMLRTMPKIRLVNSFSELHSDEYGVAFACSNRDFHFGVYVPDYHGYCHKQGRWAPEIAHSLDEVFGERYDSERFYFAVKGNFNPIFEALLEEAKEEECDDDFEYIEL